MTMGERIKQLRKAKGLTQEELGKYIGVKKAAIMKYEKGNVQNMKRSSIEILSNLFNVTPAFLMCLDEETPSNDTIPISNAIEIVKVPVLGKISAGVPIMAEESFEGYALAPATQIKEGKEYFYLRVQGDSMNLKCPEGSIVLVEKTSCLDNGEIGVIAVNGYNATIKRFKKEDNLVILEPMSTNPEHTVQIYNTKEIEIHILGKAISFQGDI